MKFSKEHREKLEELKNSTDCPDNFKCLEGEPCEICNAGRLIGSDLLECNIAEHENNNPLIDPCKFRVSFGNGYFCRCKIRAYLKKNFDI